MLNFALCQKLWGMNAKIGIIFWKSLLLQFSTNFHEKCHKCTTSQGKKCPEQNLEFWSLPKVMGSEIISKNWSLFANWYFYCFQPISMNLFDDSLFRNFYTVAIYIICDPMQWKVLVFIQCSIPWEQFQCIQLNNASICLRYGAIHM